MTIEDKARQASRQLGMPNGLYGGSECTRKHEGASYVWLLYSVFFFIEPVVRHSQVYWMQQLPWFGVFLALYVTYVQFEIQRVRVAVLAGLYLLGVGTIPFNAGGSSFFIYVTAMLPFCVEASAFLWATLALELVTLGIESQAFPGNPLNYLITGFLAVGVGVSNLFVAQQKRANARLQQAQQENVALSAVAERERIARDLHDVLGHTLSVIVLKAELAGRLLGRDNARAAVEISDVERTARTALAEVREAIGGYRAKGLRAEVEQARRTLEAAGVELTCEPVLPALDAREETVLSLAVREAVTNIVRHAGATECRIRFLTTGGFALLEVEDNGTRMEAAPREGNGLRGMRERVQELGGRFRIEAEAGTRLVIELPAAAR